MSVVPQPENGDAEYARLMRDIRFSEYRAACAQSRRLQEIAAELRSTAHRLLAECAKLRAPLGAEPPTRAPRDGR